MKGLSVPSGIIRFVCHIPMGMLAFSAKEQNDIVHKHATRLLDPRFNHNIDRGERVLYIAGMFGFRWNFFSWIPTIVAPGTLLFFLGLVDLGIVIGLAVGVCLQSTYLPQSKGGCQHAETWQVSNGTESWFHVYAIISNSTKPDPRHECEGLVLTWMLGVAMAVTYFISALCNIFLGSLGARSEASRGSYGNYNYNNSPRSMGKVLLEALRTIMLSPAYVTLAISPKRVQAKLQYSRRYFVKSTKRVPTQAIKLRPFRRKKSNADQNSERLAHLLSLDVLTLIARELHYVDLISLSLVSLSVRMAVFPDSAVSYNAEHFRILACDAGTKSQCWVCSIQICNGCQKTVSTTATEASFHIDRCKAHCSDCYYNKVHRRNYYNKSCNCGQGSYRVRGGIWAANSSTRQLICRLCNQLPLTSMQEWREARDKDEIVRLSRQPLGCSECKLPLSLKGPRWWICQTCRGECTSSIHPAWAPKLAV